MSALLAGPQLAFLSERKLPQVQRVAQDVVVDAVAGGASDAGIHDRRGGEQLYDTLGAGLTLIVLDAASGAWQPMLAAASARRVPLDIVDLRQRKLQDRYGAGLILVRPDQHVAWRGETPPESPEQIIDMARGAST